MITMVTLSECKIYIICAQATLTLPRVKRHSSLIVYVDAHKQTKAGRDKETDNPLQQGVATVKTFSKPNVFG